MAKKATKSIEGDVITIDFEETEQKLVADINDLPAEMISRLAMHGFSQKLGDSYAGCTAEEAFEKASAVLQDLKDGNWTTRVAAAGPRTTQLAEALAAVTGRTIEEAAAKLEEMDDDKKKDLRKHAQIKAKLAEIKAAKAAEAAAKATAEAGDAAPLEI